MGQRIENCRAVLFDLDGTLVDSGGDIAAAVNHVRVTVGLDPLPLATVLGFVGDGAWKLLERSFPGVDEETLRERFALWDGYYTEHCLDATRPYAGVEELLDGLSDRRLGVVSNKPEGMTRRVLEGLGMEGRFEVVLGGDSLAVKKPDPAPVLHAAEVLGADPSSCVMVGDGLTDVRAGNAAGMTTIAVSYGLVPRHELEKGEPDFFAGTPLEVLDLLV